MRIVRDNVAKHINMNTLKAFGKILFQMLVTDKIELTVIDK